MHCWHLCGRQVFWPHKKSRTAARDRAAEVFMEVRLLKVWVYAICKNEAQFVKRWLDSMGEADGIAVLDTGSSDETVSLLREGGALVREEAIRPWRFDTARNRSLELVPEDADLCVCTDLDEVFRPGWRIAAEAAWKSGVNQLRYRYIWSFAPDGREDHVFLSEKMHSRQGFRWRGAVHEVLHSDRAFSAVADGIVLEHHPDPKKSRGQYLPLLELAVAEEPENDRNCHYLGREYFFYGRWRDAIRTLNRHLSMKQAVWRDERCASMRYLARCHRELGQSAEAEGWLLRACAEAPWLREPWLELAEHYTAQQMWSGVCFAVQKLLTIQNRPLHYISEGRSWSGLPYDLLALGCYYTGQFREAEAAAKEALRFAPEDPRLQENLRLIRSRIVP